MTCEKVNWTMGKYIYMTGLYLPKPGATGMCIHQLAKETAKRGYDVTTICYADGDTQSVYDGVNVKKIKAPSFLLENMAQNKVGKKVGDKKPLNSRRQKIIAEMRDNPNITTAELHNILGVSETAVENNISFLRENGYIERVGSKKAGYWKVL